MTLNAQRTAGLKRVDGILVSVIKTVSYLSAASLIVIMLVAFLNVIGEKLGKLIPFVHGIPMSMALIQYFHIPVVFLSAGFVTLDRGHTRIDMLSSRFPKGVQQAILTVGNVLGAAVSLFISYRAFFVLTVRFFTSHSLITSSADAWPKWPFAFIHGLGFLLLGISFLWAVVRQYWLNEPYAHTVIPIDNECDN